MKREPTSEPGTGYEASDVRPGPVLISALVLTGVVGVVSWGMVGLMGGLERRAAGRDLPSGHARELELTIPGPRLQAQPALELDEHRALERARTEEYGWIDREQGLVRVPVARAVELLLERGLPARQAGEGDGR